VGNRSQSHDLLFSCLHALSCQTTLVWSLTCWCSIYWLNTWSMQLNSAFKVCVS
jgi:hypothetical protein